MIFPSVIVAGGRVEVEHQYISALSTDGTSWTFAGVPFGTAHTRRYIVAYVQVRTSGGLDAASSVTIGGVSATQMGSGAGLFYWIASVPTGTSGTVAVTKSVSVLGCEVAVWSVKRLRSTTPVAAATNAVTGFPSSITIAATTGGCILGAAVGNGPNVSWTNMTEDDEITIEGGSNFTAATHATTATETRTVSIATSGFGVPVMRLISLR